MKRLFLLIATIITMAAAPNVHAQWVEANQAPFFGGGYYGVNCIGQCGSNLFAATNYGGIIKSTDSGMDWTQVNTGLPSPSRSNYYFLRTNGSTLYVGTDSGIYVTTNNGSKWSPDTAGMGQTAIYDLYIKGDTMVASTWNNLWYIGAIYRSTNGGTSWKTDTTDIMPGTGNNFYYFTQIAFSRPNLVVAAGGIANSTTDPTGVFLSSNFGASWVHDTTTLPRGCTFEFLQAIGTTLIGGISYDSNFNYHGAIVRSTDNGVTWNELVDSVDGSPSGSPVAFAVGDSILFAGIEGGIYFSKDTGVTWQSVGPGPEANGLKTLAVIGPYLVAGFSSGQNWGGTYRREISQILAPAAVNTRAGAALSLGTYPNPITQSTTINFSAPESGVADVSVVNTLGTKVALIFSGELSAGEHTFTWNATGLPDGMYECVVRMNGQVQREAMILSR